MNELRKLRKQAGLSQAKLASLIGIEVSALSRYERGAVMPSIGMASRIAKALDISIDKLLNGPAPETWELRVIYKKTLEGDVIDLTGNASNAEVLLGERAMSIKIDGPIDLWMDDAKFEDLIADLRRKREAGMKTRKEGW